MKRRLMVIIAILALLNVYAASRIITRWPWAEQHLAIAWLLVLGFFLLQLTGPFGERLFFPGWRKKRSLRLPLYVLTWASYAAFGVMSCLIAYALLVDVISIPWKLLVVPNNPAIFDLRTLLILVGITALTALYGLRQAKVGPSVRRVEIPLRNLPESFDGFKIVQISDLHVGPTIKRNYAQNVVNMVNALSPDLIAMTGDFVDGSVADLKNDIAPLAQLRAAHGSYFVTGNHEYYWDATAWSVELTRLGAHVLNNSHQIVERDGGAIVLAGVTDYSTRGMTGDLASDPHRALHGAPADLPRILLAHQPISYEVAHEAGVDLQLSGHTHAGQYFPFTLLIRYFQRYYKGLNRHGNMWLYVNVGTGYWGPPLRAGARSEITLITLRPEPV